MTRRGLACLTTLCLVGPLLAGCRQASLELDPGVLSGCWVPGKSGQAINVRWDAAALGVDKVRLLVARPGNNARPWTQGAASGERKTGPWASDGLTVILETEDGRELARRTVETSVCEK